MTAASANFGHEPEKIVPITTRLYDRVGNVNVTQDRNGAFQVLLDAETRA
jgi:hypothetical protein